MIRFLLGILSDSHDNLPKIDAAVSKLNSLGVEQVLHAEDYCAPFAALPYQSIKAKMLGIFGNNDAEKGLLTQKFQAIGHEVRGVLHLMRLTALRLLWCTEMKTNYSDRFQALRPMTS